MAVIEERGGTAFYTNSTDTKVAGTTSGALYGSLSRGSGY